MARSSPRQSPPSSSQSTPRLEAGTQELAIEPERREQPALTDAQVVQLAELGPADRRALRPPQDIEWCLVDDSFQIVQSRPITTLFPIPVAGDQENMCTCPSVIAQMMTDALSPGALLLAADHTSAIVTWPVGGCSSMSPRLGVARRAAPVLFGGHWKSDPLIGTALETHPSNAADSSSFRSRDRSLRSARGSGAASLESRRSGPSVIEL